MNRKTIENRASKLGLRLSRKTSYCFGTLSDGVTIGRWALHHPDWAPRNGDWHATLAEVAASLDRMEIDREPRP